MGSQKRSEMPEGYNFRVPQDLGGWTAELFWTDGNTQGGPSMLVIRPKDPENVPAGGISSTVLRQVDFRDADTFLRALLDARESSMNWVREAQANAAKPIDFVREALGEGITDEYLSLLSMEYLARVDRGQAKPVDRIAEELGKSLGTIKGHLWQARKRGLLVGGSAGRKGGELSEEANELALNWAMNRVARSET